MCRRSAERCADAPGRRRRRRAARQAWLPTGRRGSAEARGARSSTDRRRVIRMRRQRGDLDAHPVIEREGLKQTVQLRFALGPVEAEDSRRGKRVRRLPYAEQMSILTQLRRGGGLGGLAVRDLSLRGSVRDIDIELDQEIHDVLQVGLSGGGLRPLNALVAHPWSLTRGSVLCDP